MIKNATDKRWPEGFALFGAVGGKKPPPPHATVETEREATNLMDVGVQTEVEDVVTEEAGEQDVVTE